MNEMGYYTALMTSGVKFSLELARWFSADRSYSGLVFCSKKSDVLYRIKRCVTGKEAGNVSFDIGRIAFNRDSRSMRWPMLNVNFNRIQRCEQGAVVACDNCNYPELHRLMVDDLGYLALHDGDSIGFTLPIADMERLYGIANLSDKFNALMMMIRRVALDYATIIGRMGFCDCGDSCDTMDIPQSMDFSSLRQKADCGDAEACYTLAHRYRDGWDCEQSDNEYIRWLRVAAEKGHVVAQWLMGIAYDIGEGNVGQDYQQAQQWYLRAAEQGYAPAQNSVGDMYNEGQGVLCDQGIAVKWFRNAASLGDVDALYNLGMSYLGGKGIPMDVPKGVELLRKAAACGDVDARMVLKDRGWS